MATEADETERLQLLLAKDVFRRGSDAVREGSRFSHGVAISHFHDAAEIAARAAAIKVSAQVRAEANFHEYWTKTNELLAARNVGLRLQHQAAMGDLSDARRLFKHRGKMTDSAHVVGFEATTRKFLVDTYRDFFSVSFDSISAVTFVRELRVKQNLENAQEALGENNIGNALERCADAWAVISSQQRVFFPAPADHGITVSYDKQMEAILYVTRGEFANIFDHLHQLARLTFAALLGLNAADLLLLLQTLPVKQGERYSHPRRREAVSAATVGHIIELIADYSSALLRHIDGFTRPAWMESPER